MRTRFTLSLTLVLTLLMLSADISPRLYASSGDVTARRVYPNPFTVGTVFQLTMPKSARIRISVYDLLGRLIRTLHDGVHPEGKYDVPWDGNDLNGNPVPHGIYICVLFSEDVQVKSVKVIKVAS